MSKLRTSGKWYEFAKIFGTLSGLWVIGAGIFATLFTSVQGWLNICNRLALADVSTSQVCINEMITASIGILGLINYGFSYSLAFAVVALVLCVVGFAVDARYEYIKNREKNQ